MQGKGCLLASSAAMSHPHWPHTASSASPRRAGMLCLIVHTRPPCTNTDLYSILTGQLLHIPVQQTLCHICCGSVCLAAGSKQVIASLTQAGSHYWCIQVYCWRETIACLVAVFQVEADNGTSRENNMQMATKRRRCQTWSSMTGRSHCAMSL